MELLEAGIDAVFEGNAGIVNFRDFVQSLPSGVRQ